MDRKLWRLFGTVVLLQVLWLMGDSYIDHYDAATGKMPRLFLVRILRLAAAKEAIELAAYKNPY